MTDLGRVSGRVCAAIFVLGLLPFGLEAQDLVVQSVSGPSGPLSAGAQASVSIVVRNQGSISAGPNGIVARLYLSTDQSITTSDTPIPLASNGSTFIPLQSGALGADAVTTSTPFVVRIPSTLGSGTYYWGAIADPSNSVAETIESNNTGLGNALALQGSSTLVVTVSPAGTQTIVPGASLLYTITVRDGNGAPVSGAVVGVTDNVMSINASRNTNVSGQASYTTTAPTGCSGARTIQFQASRSGYSNSPVVTANLNCTTPSLSLTVTPPSSVPVTLSPGQSQTYALSVVDQAGVAVSGVSVAVVDGPGGGITPNVFPNASGQATYQSTALGGCVGTKTITFRASKTGYTQSALVSRSVVCAMPALLLTVSPSNAQSALPGATLSYLFTVRDANNVAVSDAALQIANNVNGSNAGGPPTAANGTSSYSFLVPASCTSGTKTIEAQASKVGFGSSNVVTLVVTCLSPLGGIAVTVAGAPGAGLVVSLFNPSGNLIAAQQTDATSVARFSELSPATGYVVRVNSADARGRDWWGDVVGVQVAAGVTTALTFARTTPYISRATWTIRDPSEPVLAQYLDDAFGVTPAYDANGGEFGVRLMINNPSATSRSVRVKGMLVLSNKDTAKIDQTVNLSANSSMQEVQVRFGRAYPGFEGAQIPGLNDNFGGWPALGTAGEGALVVGLRDAVGVNPAPYDSLTDDARIVFSRRCSSLYSLERVNNASGSSGRDVILIHGYTLGAASPSPSGPCVAESDSDPNNYFSLSESVGNTASFWPTIKAQLQADGTRMWAFRWPTTQSLRGAGEVLQSLVRSKGALIGNDVVLVGHSMGGAVALEALVNLEGLRDKVTKVITLGSPLNGTSWASVGELGSQFSAHEMQASAFNDRRRRQTRITDFARISVAAGGVDQIIAAECAADRGGCGPAVGAGLIRVPESSYLSGTSPQGAFAWLAHCNMNLKNGICLPEEVISYPAGAPLYRSAQVSSLASAVLSILSPSNCSLILAASPVAGGTAVLASGGTMNGSCGRTVTPLATPNPGYTFVSWSDGNLNASRPFVVSASSTLTANFTPLPCELTIAASPQAGGVVAFTNGSVASGTCGRSVTVQATPNAGYTFAGWSDGNLNSSRAFIVSGTSTLTATFTAVPCILTLTANPVAGGTAVLTNGGTSGGACGRSVTVQATPNVGYTFASWSDGNMNASRSFIVSSTSTLTASFTSEVAPCVLALVASPVAGGTTTLTSGTSSGTCGRSVSVQANANVGYAFVSWSDGNVNASRLVTVSTLSSTLTATFATISSAPATKLGFVVSPASASQGQAITPTAVVQLLDASGGAVAEANRSVSVRLESGAGPLSGTLTGLTDALGRATFSDVRIESQGAHVLRYYGPGVTGVSSATLNVGPPIVSECVITLASNPTAGGTTTFTGGSTSIGACGRSVTVQATPNAGYAFTSWSDGNTSASRSYIVNSTTTLTGTFAALPCVLTLAVNPSAGGSAVLTNGSTSGGTCGRSVSVQASANVGYAFVSWSDGNVNASRLVTVSTLSSTLTATFATISSAPATKLGFVVSPASASQGQAITPTAVVQLLDASGGAVAEANRSVSVRLESGAGPLSGTLTGLTDALGRATFSDVRIESQGAHVLRYYGPGVTGVSSATLNVGPPIVSECVITLASNPTAGGTTTFTGGSTSIGACGRSVTVQATPNAGYAFTSWSDGNTSASRSYMVSSTHTLTAAFATVPCVLTLAANPVAGGTVAFSNGSTSSGVCGRSVTVQATPNAGFAFASWSDGNSNASRAFSVNSSSTLSASFSIVAGCVWCNTLLTFAGNVLPAGWQLGYFGPNQGRILNERIETYATDRGITLRAAGTAPVGALAVEVISEGPMADIYWGMNNSLQLITGATGWDLNVSAFTCPAPGCGPPSGQTNQLVLSATRRDGVSFPWTSTGGTTFGRVPITYPSGTVLKISRLFMNDAAILTVKRASDGVEFGSVQFSMPGFRVSEITGVDVAAYYTSQGPTLPIAWLDNIDFRVLSQPTNAATNLAIITPPSAAISGQPVSPVSMVELRDALNQPVREPNRALSVRMQTGSGVLGGTITALTDAEGRARFPDIRITGVGSQSLRYYGPNVTGVTSPSFSVAAAAAAFAPRRTREDLKVVILVAEPVRTAIGSETDATRSDFKIVAGSLPAGLTLEEDGFVVGVPTDTGATNLRVAWTERGVALERRVTLTALQPTVEWATTRIARALLKPADGVALSTAEGHYLDRAGNRNGAIDLGDLLALIQRNPSARLDRVLIEGVLSRPDIRLISIPLRPN